MMGLRLGEGVDLDGLSRRFGDLSRYIDMTAHDRLVRDGLVERAAGRLRVTAPGRLVLNRILGMLLADVG